MGVNPPSRFGEIQLQGDQVTAFSEKPEFKEKWINGGYFFFRPEFFSKYLNKCDDCVLEQEPLIQLAGHGELSLYKHRGFWAPMDTQRDRETLCNLWESGQAPWASPMKAIHGVASKNKDHLMSFLNTFSGKTILITGHTGFKGAWLSLWLKQLGANVIGYSLPPPTDPNAFETPSSEKTHHPYRRRCTGFISS